MQYLQWDNAPSKKIAGSACLLSAALLSLCFIGCSTNKTSDTPPDTPTQGAQTYFSPVGGGKQIFAIDDFGNKFSQSSILNTGPQIIIAGGVTATQRGLLSLGITASYARNIDTNKYDATTYSPPKPGGFAVELAGQAGGLLQLVGGPMVPLVAAVQCPNSKTAQTYQFLTIPGALVDSSVVPIPGGTWNPKTDTAYGSVDISSDGPNLFFKNISQYTLPSVGGSGVPAQQPSSSVSVTGACGPTFRGSTIVVGQATVTDPSTANSGKILPQASMGIGPTGLLVEDNGSVAGGTFPNTSPALPYDNTLGAGTGAIGLPKPSSPLDTSALLHAQYLGFVYGAGTPVKPSDPTNWSSHLASFGFPNAPALPPACSSFAAQTGPLVNGIYGGDFPQSNGQDNPSASPDGFGKCDLAIDLGTQDDSGLFPKATVWLGDSYAANTTGKTYSFPAVAIAGQLDGKYAIFLLGVDTKQPWTVYLLPSN